MAVPSTEIKFDTALIGRIPVLTGPKNYDCYRPTLIFPYFSLFFLTF
jgi:hypothetical protein